MPPGPVAPRSAPCTIRARVGRKETVTMQGDLITPTGRLVLPPGHIGDEQWLEFRRMRADVPGKYCIGSSDVPSILDLDGVDTPVHVYRQKVKGVKTAVNEAMIWGHLNEPTIAARWCQINRAVIDEIGLVSREGTPWHQSTIDRRVRECPVDRSGECLLEVKNVGYATGIRWHREIPDRILAQIIHQLYVTGYAHAHWAALIGGNQLKQGIIYADRETKLMKFIIGEVERFRDEHLIAGVEPRWDSTSKPDKMIELDNATYPNRAGEVDIEGVGAVMAYAEAAAEAGAATKRRKALAAELRQLAGGAEVVTFSGERAYWYGEGHGTNVDLMKLKERWPDAYDACVTENTWPVLNVDKVYKPKRGKA